MGKLQIRITTDTRSCFKSLKSHILSLHWAGACIQVKLKTNNFSGISGQTLVLTNQLLHQVDGRFTQPEIGDWIVTQIATRTWSTHWSTMAWVASKLVPMAENSKFGLQLKMNSLKGKNLQMKTLMMLVEQVGSLGKLYIVLIFEIPDI